MGHDTDRDDERQGVSPGNNNNKTRSPLIGGCSLLLSPIKTQLQMNIYMVVDRVCMGVAASRNSFIPVSGFSASWC